MPEIRPFRGVRYDLARVGDLSEVVAPPYDVVGPDLQAGLLDRSPHNVIRLELGLDEPGDDEASNRYTRAARLLKDWRREGVLADESNPALYVYHQSFRVEGKEYTRKGFLARVRLEPFGRGKIYPHEETMSGPKADRLKLYEATGFNLSPVFGLYPDPTNHALGAVEAGIRDRTPLTVTDHLGVENRLWPVTEVEALAAVQGLMADKPVFIADGHHRYETAVRYRDDRAASGQLSGPDDPANFCLMMLVSMGDPGLQILPTHRLASGYPGLSTATLAERLAPEFDLEDFGEGPSGCLACWQEMELDGAQNVLGFGTVDDGRWTLARLRSDATMGTLVPEHSDDWRSLGVSILQELVYKKLLADLGTPERIYVHLLDEVTEAVASRSCDLACLVPPAGMEHVEVIASNLEKMPPKSTYFYPKLLTGLVLNPIR
ncbi:DUF1015 domain-containing protein [Tautonia plasticadhaerens]|uniref:DUF1015 domain-containing protein n=1 Tax=Tautonia plasticadhaerens TaxID=2527974 RepID=A0A518GXE0_9BACT|nr:DUF1015 domain-containing protein [Tautonia plasticadhaerens]QDV33243.1 hypothetical protein ElP_10850 [Tautonia plasticadhaerens]